MNRPYVEKLRVQNFGCIRDAEIQLTPLHALIGPNDSGKSTVLRALRTLCWWAGNMAAAREESYQAVVSTLRASAARGAGLLRAETGGVWWEVGMIEGKLVEKTSLQAEARVIADWTQMNQLLGSPALANLATALRGATLLRADPDEMRKPSGLIQDGQPLRFKTDRGEGLAGVYDAILVRDLPAYIAINDAAKKLFPSVKSISAKNPTAGTKAIGVQLVDGTFVPADEMSEGLLYFLAFAALPHLEPASLLLIEEPENGLHPARISEVMRILRDISETTQVVLATHSPLVINELEGHEVTLLTRTPEHGTTARLLQDTFNYAERSKIYANGELWLSYANGEDERDLFQAPEAAQ